MSAEMQRDEDQRVSQLALRLCTEWRASQHRQHGFSIDELSAFWAGVVAAERERKRTTLTKGKRDD